jgi:alkanesulfonate monooxygenase SsuD/methylene tetrahydromethanopterin reductase-like flavin-dependent oxidoreductase (luciferase family)
MPDLGHDLRFGLFLTPDAAGHQAVVRRALRAEELGLDLVGIQDHPYQPSFLDTWTLLSTLAPLTDHLQLVPDVLNLPLRPPAVLARAAATLDLLSNGRVELGLGAGAFWDGITAMGADRRTAPESVEALEEAVAVLRALWGEKAGDEKAGGGKGRGVHFEGKHYRLAGARPGPAPAHRIGIWLGAYGPRMLKLTARVADGWLPSSMYAAPDKLAEMTAIVDSAASDAGRDPAAIRRVYNIAGRFTRPRSGSGSGLLDGPPAEWADQLTDLAMSYGVSGFVLAPGADPDRDLRIFAEEVVPLVRQNVEQERDPEAKPLTPEVIEVASDGVVRADGSLDDASRPRLPKRDLGELTPAQRRAGQHLVAIHDHLRGELSQLVGVVDQVAAGRADPAAARGLINQLTMRQNYWTLGAFCASYCRVLTTHHTIEDEHMFVELGQAQESLAPVLARLGREHEVIAGVLTGLDEALVATVADPARLDEVRDRVELLADQLLSHLAYEEEELVEPLGRLDILV